MVDRVFVDVDTQVDFVDPAGALYVPGSQEIIANLRRLLEHAGAQRITTISSMCAHVANDAEFEQFPPHCLEGTPGQRRYFDDLPKLPRRRWTPDAAVTTEDLQLEPGSHYVVQKRSFPMFTNPWVRALGERGLFRHLPCVVFGVATDVCVRANVLDLCAAGAHAEVVRDAIAGINPEAVARAIDEMRAAGARLVTTDDVLRRP